ncbi:MAG: MFS transporter [Planctomycetes bacterium]|nr:MFS transporter [Planctomycetota bacterium]
MSGTDAGPANGAERGVPRFLARLGLTRREHVAWAFYDWANSALWTTVITAVFPIYYAKVAAEGLDPRVADGRFTRATTLCLALAAISAPVLGAVADFSGRRKRWLAAFLFVGAAATASMFWIQRGEWLFALVAFGLANLGAIGSMVFYDSLLPHVARADELDRVSSGGYALGYLGGGLLLALNLAWIQRPDWFGLDGADPTLPTRLSFLSVAVWWLVFSIPLFRGVKEPPRTLERDETGAGSPWRVAFTRLWETVRELKRHRHAVIFMLAFFAYSDGIGTIIRMSSLLGSHIGMSQGNLIGAFLLVQFVGMPFAFLFGWAAGRFGAKRMIFVALASFLAATLVASRMSTTREFYLLALLVAASLGGCQALSRSLFASLVPKHKSAECFGLFSSLERFSAILGPLVYGLVLEHSGATGPAVLSVAPFFLVGAVLLAFVDVGAGQRAAAESEREATGA